MCGFLSRKFNDYNKKNLGSMLLCTTSDDEMTQKNKGLHLKTLLFLDIYI
jgi:hypothetical protein